MSPRDLVYVGHMLDMARKAVSKTQGISREAYDADENLRKLTGKTMAFDPAGDAAARQRGVEQWRKYFLKDYWLVPPPSKP